MLRILLTFTISLTLYSTVCAMPTTASTECPEEITFIMPDNTVVCGKDGINHWIDTEGLDWLRNNFEIVDEEPVPDSNNSNNNNVVEAIPEARSVPDIMEVPDANDFDDYLYDKLEQGKAPCTNRYIGSCQKVWI